MSCRCYFCSLPRSPLPSQCSHAPTFPGGSPLAYRRHLVQSCWEVTTTHFLGWLMTKGIKAQLICLKAGNALSRSRASPGTRLKLDSWNHTSPIPSVSYCVPLTPLKVSLKSLPSINHSQRNCPVCLERVPPKSLFPHVSAGCGISTGFHEVFGQHNPVKTTSWTLGNHMCLYVCPQSLRGETDM